jgi:ABC-type uncharacterized transport system substrate-binding protein
MPVMGDPVGDALVASLGRPGGNITGLTFLGPELLPKRLALLNEALPNISRVAALWHPGAYGERTISDMMKEAEATAQALGVHLRSVAAQGPDQLDRAFPTIAVEQADGLMVFPSPMLFSEGRRIVDLAAKHRLPSMSMARELVELGGLMSHGASIRDLQRRAAPYVDKWSSRRSSSWSSTWYGEFFVKGFSWCAAPSTPAQLRHRCVLTAGVGEAPRHEIAGGGSPAVQRAIGN